MLEQKATGAPRKAVALIAQAGAPPPRAGYQVLSNGQKIGVLTSGMLSPSLQVGIGLALIESQHAAIGNSVDIEIRGRNYTATIVKKPIYRKSN